MLVRDFPPGAMGHAAPSIGRVRCVYADLASVVLEVAVGRTCLRVFVYGTLLIAARWPVHGWSLIRKYNLDR